MAADFPHKLPVLLVLVLCTAHRSTEKKTPKKVHTQVEYFAYETALYANADILGQARETAS